MLNVYLNYPNSKVTVHGEATCSTIRQMRKPGQRQVRIDEGSREQELAQFEAAHRFASRAKYNDMWVVVDLASQREEDLVVENIRRALARRYEPFREARVEKHC